jgi:hypothetical protein
MPQCQRVKSATSRRSCPPQGRQAERYPGDGGGKPDTGLLQASR